MERYGIHRRYEHLLHDVRHGLFVKKEFWRNEWVFDAKQVGPYISVWIDSYRQYDLLASEERQKSEAAFRHGYRTELKSICAKLESLPPHLLQFHCGMEEYAVTDGATADLLYIATEAARDARYLFHWKNMSALPNEDESVGQVVYGVSHWLHAAYLRGIHDALEHLVAQWNELSQSHHEEKRCGHTYLMEMTLPLLLLNADQWRECAIPVALFPMMCPGIETQSGKQNNVSLSLTDERKEL